MVIAVFMLSLTVSELKSKVKLISEISEFSYLAVGQIGKLLNLGKIFLSFKTELNFNIWQVFSFFFLNVSEQKSEVRLISEFSYLALRQIRKLRNLGKIFLSFRNDLSFMSNYGSQF